MNLKTTLLDENAVKRALFRISHEILERNKGADDVALIGIMTRGVPMAQRIRDDIFAIEGIKPPTGSIDITLYRDDLSEKSEFPTVNRTDVDFSVKNKKIVLCDDVLFTGRTARAALEAVLKLGRPRCIQLAVLVDRGHRELPIRADYVGKNVPTTMSEVIAARFDETDGCCDVRLFQL